MQADNYQDCYLDPIHVKIHSRCKQSFSLKKFLPSISEKI